MPWKRLSAGSCCLTGANFAAVTSSYFDGKRPLSKLRSTGIVALHDVDLYQR